YHIHHCVLHPFPTRRSSDLSWLNPHLLVATLDAGTAEMFLQPMHPGCCYCRQDDKRCKQRQAPRYQPQRIKSRAVRREAGKTDKDRKSTRLNSSHEWISYAI